MSELVIVDSRIANYETLLDGLAADTQILLLDSDHDGVQQIADYLDDKSGFDALHIVSHGRSGVLNLGNSIIDQEKLTATSVLWREIGNSLTANGDILIYGCNAAQGTIGESFIETIATLTNSDVAASTDPTGAATLGGDWQLEFQTNTVETTALHTDIYDQLLLTEVESNNTRTTANAASLYSTITGQLSSPTDLDYFKFTVGATGSIRLNFNRPDNIYSGYFTIGLEDANGVSLAYYTDSSDPQTFTVGIAQAGTYFVRIGSYYNYSFYNGQYALAAIAMNDNGELLGNFPVTTPMQNSTVPEDTELNITLPINEFSGYSGNLTYRLIKADGSALPAWISFNPSTLRLSGNPDNSNVETIDILIVATDSNNAIGLDEFTITVPNVNDTPILNTPITNKSINEDQGFIFSVATSTFTDIDVGDALTYIATQQNNSPLPSWLSFNATTQTFSGTPTNPDVGSINVRITAKDVSNTTAYDDFTITIINTNDAPTVTDPIPDQTATEDQPWSYVIPDNTFTDIDIGDTLTLSAIIVGGDHTPAWLHFNVLSKLLYGTPGNDNVGYVDVRITATDGNNATVADVLRINVANTNDATTGSVSIDGSVILGQTLTASNTLADVDGLGAITYQWQASSDGTNWDDISTGSSLLLNESLIGKQIKVVASFVDGHGTRESVSSSASQAVDGNGDVPGSIASTGTLNDSVVSQVDYPGDQDYYRVELVAGEAYQFDLKGNDGGGGNHPNPWLRLLSSNGTVLLADDDGSSVYDKEEGHLHDSQIVFIPETSGYYYLSATGFDDATGTYTLTSTHLADDYYLKSILNSYGTNQDYWKWEETGLLSNNTAVTYSFPSVKPSDYGNEETTGFIAMSPQQQIAVRQALEDITSHTWLTFTEVSEDLGDIRFATSDQVDSGGVTYLSWNKNIYIQADIAIDNTGTNSNYPTGGFQYFTVVHEIGHALGLKHPGEYDSTGTGPPGPYLPTSQDATPYTVESYNSSTSYLDIAPSAYLMARSMMAFDIAALQFLYGPNTSTHTGDDSYVFDSTAMYSIWDAAGVDTLNATEQSSAVTLNLTPGGLSYLGHFGIDVYGRGLSPRLSIAFETIIENAIGGNGDDLLIGNKYDNLMSGGDGIDHIDSGAGDDELLGGDDNDILYGGDGNDRFDWDSTGRAGSDKMYGGPGDDEFVIDSLFDDIFEYASEGMDKIWAAISYSLGNLDNIEHLYLFGALPINATGNSLDNTLRGNENNNEISGLAGNDYFYGASGDDTLDGGTGVDIAKYTGNRADYIITAIADGYTIIDRVNDRDGVDSLYNIEKLRFADMAALDIGNIHSPTITTPIYVTYTDTDGDDSFNASSGVLVGSDMDGDILTYGIAEGIISSDGLIHTRTGLYGTLAVAIASGSYTFTPSDIAIESVQSSTDESFTVTVSDGVNTSTAIFTVNIAGADDTTNYIGDLTGLVTEDHITTTSGTLTISDRDAGDEIIIAQLDKPGNHGTFNISSNGLWSYLLQNDAADIQALKAGQTITDTFTVSSAGSTSQEIVITIQGNNDIPVLASHLIDQTLWSNSPFIFTIPADTFTDPDLEILSYCASQADGSDLPSWLLFDSEGRSFGGTPGPLDIGILDIRVTAKDSANSSASDYFRLTIQPDMTAPTVIITDNLPGTANRTTGSIAYTLTFSESVTGLALDDFTVTNGVISSVSGGGATWTVNVTPAFGVVTGNINLTLKADAVSDASGNLNAAASNSSQAIDTVAPVAPKLVTAAGTHFVADPQITMQTSLGTVVLELHPEQAPVTVANLLAYADAGFYDGTLFHRVIEDFMVQGGGFTTGLVYKTPTYAAIPLESNNGLANLRGSIAMARTSAADSATSQFFINHVDNAFLNYSSVASPGYAVFGHVLSGLSVVDSIAEVATTTRNSTADVPVTDVTITSIRQTTAGRGISSVNTLQVSGLEVGAAWSYSLDGGASWNAGSGSSITLPLGDYAEDAIQVRQTDAAGNASAGAGSLSSALLITNQAVSAPTVSISENLAGVANLGTGNVAYTLTFSEAVTGLAVDDFIVSNGVASSVSGSGTSWLVNVTPESGVASGSIGVVLRTGAVSDAGGDVNALAANSGQAIDTVAPVAPKLVTSAAFDYLVNPQITMQTSLGSVVFELRPEQAPITVANMLAYVDAGFYDGTLIHQVIPGFVLQGGSYTHGLVYKEPLYGAIALESNNGLTHVRGSLAMVRGSTANSATTQFFIDLVDNPGLNYTSSAALGYAVFGQIVSGLTVIDSIAQAPTTSTSPTNVPLTDVTITSIQQTVAGSAISNVNTLQVSDLAANTTWSYSLNGGVTWQAGSGASLILPDASYAANAIQIRQTDSAGNTSARTGKLTSALVVDTIAPSVTQFNPADEAVGVALAANIVLTFSETIVRGAGSIVLKTLAGDIVESFDAASSVRLTFSGATLSIDPTLDLAHSSGYKVELAAGAVKDLAGNSHAGANSYNFTTNTPTSGRVSIDGQATPGHTLSANISALADVDGLGSFNYQWKADGNDIVGATDPTLLLGEAQAGKAITVSVSHTDGHGNTEQITSVVIRMGGNGNDSLTSLSDSDRLSGGPGDDLYSVLASTNVLTELPDEGIDSVYSPISWTLGENLENLILTGTGNRSGTGNLLDNHLTGYTGNNTLNGGPGRDTLVGGPGNDTYVVDHRNDVALETSALDGVDTVRAGLSWTLGEHLENLVLTGLKKYSATGNTLNNTLTGNSAANTLNGGPGADTLIGDAGNDTYVVDNAGDVIQETRTSATEIDTVRASLNWTLGANLENLVLTGAKHLSGTGNSLNNSLFGNSGNNLLNAGDGNDLLNGDSGADTLTGGPGADTFAFSAALAVNNIDTITDFSSGADKIQLSAYLFSQIGFTGAPTSDAFFHNGANAMDSDDRILYDASNGSLYYDADGTGALAAVKFAVLSGAPTLLYSDFVAG